MLSRRAPLALSKRAEGAGSELLLHLSLETRDIDHVLGFAWSAYLPGGISGEQIENYWQKCP